jgi:hypothetical protein
MVIRRCSEEKNLYHETANVTNRHGKNAPLMAGFF